MVARKIRPKKITVQTPEEKDKEDKRKTKENLETIKTTRQNINAAKGISQEIRGWTNALRSLKGG